MVDVWVGGASVEIDSWMGRVGEGMYIHEWMLSGRGQCWYVGRMS